MRFTSSRPQINTTCLGAERECHILQSVHVYTATTTVLSTHTIFHSTRTHTTTNKNRWEREKAHHGTDELSPSVFAVKKTVVSVQFFEALSLSREDRRHHPSTASHVLLKQTQTRAHTAGEVLAVRVSNMRIVVLLQQLNPEAGPFRPLSTGSLPPSGTPVDKSVFAVDPRRLTSVHWSTG